MYQVPLNTDVPTDIRGLINLITKTRLYKYIENFTTKKRKLFRLKKSDIFHISAQNIDCGCKPQFYYIKVGFNGVKII